MIKLKNEFHANKDSSLHHCSHHDIVLMIQFRLKKCAAQINNEIRINVWS